MCVPMADCNGTLNESCESTKVQQQIQHTLVPALDILIMVTGLVGHSLVIFILAGRIKRKSLAQPPHGTDTLLLALSACDMMLLLCLPFHTVAIAIGRWPFGDFMCKLISFLGVGCNSASAFTLAALATTRYLTVVHPTWAFRSHMQRWLSVSAILLWGPAIAIAAPQFAIRAVVTSATVQCFVFLSTLSQVVYSSALFLFSFALPLTIIVLMYGKIYLFLRKTQRQSRAPQLERYQSQVTKTSALLVLVFTICWLPSHILMFSLIGKTLGGPSSYNSLAIFARLLATSSSVMNPLLYAFMSQKFRQELLALCQTHCGNIRGWSSVCPCRGRDMVQPFNPVEQDTPTPPPG